MWYNDIKIDATDMVGNWREWYSYSKYAHDSNPDTQVILCLNESWPLSLLDQSNIDCIEKELEKADPDNYEMLNKSEIRITALDSKGEETTAWATIVEIASALSDYPVLDDTDFSEREYVELLDNIDNELTSAGLGFIDANKIQDHFEFGSYPDTDEVVKRAKEYIEKHVDIDGAAVLIDVALDHDRDLLTDHINLADITPVIEEMETADLETLQEKINAELKLRKVGQ